MIYEPRIGDFGVIRSRSDVPKALPEVKIYKPGG